MENRKATLVDFYMMCKNYYDDFDESCDDCPLHENGCFSNTAQGDMDITKLNDKVLKWKDKHMKKQKEMNSLMSEYNGNINIELGSNEKDKATLFDFARMCKCYYNKEDDDSCDGCPLDYSKCFCYCEAAETNINKINKKVLKWTHDSTSAPSTHDSALTHSMHVEGVYNEPNGQASSDSTQDNKHSASSVNKGDSKVNFIEAKNKKCRYFINTSAIKYIKDDEEKDFIEIHFENGHHLTFPKPTINIYDKICNDVQESNASYSTSINSHSEGSNNSYSTSINTIFEELFGI